MKSSVSPVAGHICVVAPAPPPVTGQSVYYSYLRKVFSGTRASFFPLYTRPLNGGAASYVTKILRTFRVVVELIAARPSVGVLVVDDGPGLLLNGVVAIVFRCRRVPLFVSHHTFRYVDKPSLLMRAFLWAAGRRLTHIFLCACMRQRFEGLYGTSGALILSNARQVALGDAVGSDDHAPDGFVIGYISNISFEKGIREFVETARRLRVQGCLDLAVVAGPASNDEVARFMEAAVAEFDGVLHWLGPVYGDAKAKFFRSLSVLVFPTRYSVEAQPNVVFEALSFGIPVVTTSKGCLPEDLAGTSSIAIGDEDGFVECATEVLIDLHRIHQRRQWEEISRGVRGHFAALAERAREEEGVMRDAVLAASNSSSSH